MTDPWFIYHEKKEIFVMKIVTEEQTPVGNANEMAIWAIDQLPRFDESNKVEFEKLTREFEKAVMLERSVVGTDIVHISTSEKRDETKALLVKNLNKVRESYAQELIDSEQFVTSYELGEKIMEGIAFRVLSSAIGYSKQTGYPVCDLIQAGLENLWETIVLRRTGRKKEEIGFSSDSRFTSYGFIAKVASYGVLSAFRDNIDDIRIPENVKTLYRKFERKKVEMSLSDYRLKLEIMFAIVNPELYNKFTQKSGVVTDSVIDKKPEDERDSFILDRVRSLHEYFRKIAGNERKVLKTRARGPVVKSIEDACTAKHCLDAYEASFMVRSLDVSQSRSYMGESGFGQQPFDIEFVENIIDPAAEEAFAEVDQELYLASYIDFINRKVTFSSDRETDQLTRSVLNLRFGLGREGAEEMTMQQIAEELGIKVTRARSLEKGALRKLRHPSYIMRSNRILQ